MSLLVKLSVPCGLSEGVDHLLPLWRGIKRRMWAGVQSMCFGRDNCQLKFKSFKSFDFNNQTAYDIGKEMRAAVIRGPGSWPALLESCLFQTPLWQLPGHRGRFVKDPQGTMRENSFCFIRLDEFMCLGAGCPGAGGGEGSRGPCGHH